MKSQILLVVLFIGFGLAAVTASAQAGGVKANIPFDFTAAGKTLPAGQYMLIADSNQVTIEDAKGRAVAMILANHTAERSAGATGQVVFHCYRYRCFLAELWSPAQMDGRQVLTSRAEANLAKEAKAKYFAVLGLAAAK